jgi:signal transduction histidine kinase
MKLSLATRIFLGYAVVLVTFGAVSVFSVRELHENQGEIRLVSQGYLHLSQDVAAIETFHKNQERDLDRLTTEQNVQVRRSLILIARRYTPPLMTERLQTAIDKAKEIQSFVPSSEASFVSDIETKLLELQRRYGEYVASAEVVFKLLEQAQPDNEKVTQLMSQLKGLETSIGRDIRVLHLTVEGRIRERVSMAERRERRTGIAIIALSVLAIGVGLLVTAISARLLRPVRTLIEGVSRIGRGDYSAELGIRGDDEISVLAREFDQMARSLREREAQLKEKQEALLRAEQLAAVGRISAQIAHEVRNPLSSIGLNVDLLNEALAKAQFSSKEEVTEATQLLAAVTREVDRLTDVTEQYLAMAKPHKPALQPEDIPHVIDTVLDFSRPELERAEIRVETSYEKDGPKALADENQLKQVFLNLIRNSREAMAGGGVLKVRSRAVNGHLEVEFTDNGRGMNADVRDRIFEPFFTTKEGGTGLGLSVTQQILQAHGGSIECHSTPGTGTTFVIRLPRA